MTFAAVAAIGAGGATAACTVTATTITSDDGGGISTYDSGPDTNGDDGSSSTTDGGAEAEASTPTTYIRFANWSPDAPTAGYDFCLTPHGTTNWQGPVLGTELGDAGILGDGGTSAIQTPWVTAYFGVDPAQYDVAVVAAGATSCASPLTTANSLPSLADGAFTTIAILGDTNVSGSDKALYVAAFPDDSTAPSGGAALRFINAAPDLAAVDFGTGSNASGASTAFQAVFTNVAFGAAGSQAGSDAGTVDSNGYIAVAPVAGVELSAHVSQGGTGDTATASSQSLSAGSITTMVLVNGKNGETMPPPQFLVCTSDGQSSTSLLSPCTIVTQ
jgi:hypothetical protein